MIEEEKNLILKEKEDLNKRMFVINAKKLVIGIISNLGLTNVETPVDQEKDLIIVVEVEITIKEEIEEEDIAHLIQEIEEEIEVEAEIEAEIENIMIEEDDLCPLEVHQDQSLNNLDQTHHLVRQDLIVKIQSGKLLN